MTRVFAMTGPACLCEDIRRLAQLKPPVIKTDKVEILSANPKPVTLNVSKYLSSSLEGL